MPRLNLSPKTPETNTFHAHNHCYLDYIMERFVEGSRGKNPISLWRKRSNLVSSMTITYTAYVCDPTSSYEKVCFNIFVISNSAFLPDVVKVKSRGVYFVETFIFSVAPYWQLWYACKTKPVGESDY